MDVQFLTSGGQDYIDHREICNLTGVAEVWLTTGHFTGVLRLRQAIEGR